MNPSRRWRLAESHHVTSSLAKRSNPNTKANQTQNSANQTQSTEVFIKKKKKKKKILNTQTKTKPSNPRTVTSPSSSPQRARRPHRRSPGHPSSQIGDRHRRPVDGRSVIGSSLYASASAPVSGASCLLRQFGLPQGFSLTLSQFLSLYLTE